MQPPKEIAAGLEPVCISLAARAERGEPVDGGYVAASEDTGETAEQLIALGFPLVPLRPVFFSSVGARGECNCDSPMCAATGGGKHPAYGGWSNAADRALPGNKERLEDARTWRRAPALGVGIATGMEFRPGRFLGLIDVDVANGKPGLQSLADLERSHGPLPATVTVRTGSGGLQYYVLSGSPLKSTASWLAPSIDTRGAGGYGVAPPSMHKSGRRYTWYPGRAPWEVDVAPIPEAWADAVHAARSREPAHRSHPVARARSRFSPETARRNCIGVINHPAWRWALENPDDVHRVTWIGFATNLAAACDGHEPLITAARKAFRELSQDYSGYSVAETERVFDEAATFVGGGGGPYLWATMCDVPAHLVGAATALVEDVRRGLFRRGRP